MITLAAGAMLLFACDAEGRLTAPPSPSASSSSHVADYCNELGFEDGEQRSEDGELVAECREGATPEDGAYSIVRYSDDDGPADKEAATAAEITVYDEHGNVVSTTTGPLSGD